MPEIKRPFSHYCFEKVTYCCMSLKQSSCLQNAWCMAKKYPHTLYFLQKNRACRGKPQYHKNLFTPVFLLGLVCSGER